MNKVLHFQDIEIEDRQIVENTLALWLACLLYQPDILYQFYAFTDQFNNIKDLLLNGITKPKSLLITKEFQNSLY